MGMIGFKTTGSWKNTSSWLARISKGYLGSGLEKYGERGVDALSSATPRESGQTAESWGYRIKRNDNGFTIEWYNKHVVDGVNIAIILQYGHGTGTGGWVQGQNYINPAIRPVMDKIADDIWKEVRNG
jgi:hypothetical protein